LLASSRDVALSQDRSVEWDDILNQAMVLVGLQAKRLNQAAASPEGPERFARGSLLVEHPFGRFEKWLSETVLVAYLAATTEGVPISIRNSALRIASGLSSLVSHPAYCRVWLRLPYSSLTSVGGAQAMLEELGVADSKGTEALHAALSLGSRQWESRGAPRAAERSWLNRRAVPTNEGSLAQRWPDEIPHPIYLLRSDVYGLTHDVWFGTDFGRLMPDSGSNVEAVFRAIGPWLVLIGDLDCLGEVIASQLMLCEEPDPGLEALYRLSLLRKIVGVTTETQRRPQRPRSWFGRMPRDRPVLFRVTDYHPAYVGLVAAIAWLRRGSSARQVVSDVRDTLSSRILAVFSSRIQSSCAVPSNLRPPSWPSTRETLSLISAESAIDGMLISAAKRRELTLMCDLLRAWRAETRPATWTVSESEAFVTLNAVGA
jgi:hypothetical protein